METLTRKLCAPLLSLCTGCVSFQQTHDDVAVRLPGDRVISVMHPVEQDAKRHVDYAWMAQSAYEKTGDGKNIPESCMDADLALAQARWTPWNGFPNDPKDPHLNDDLRKYHLRVEVWSRQDPPQVAVAFGGTVFGNRNDWRANLRWFIPAHDDQYTLVVRRLGPAFIDEFNRRLALDEWNGALPVIVSTGHSLGGGLAQQFAYALPNKPGMPRVSKVYAFHPSPVTGYFSVDKPVREINARGLEIERIYERGEILALLRSLQSVFFVPSVKHPAITGYRYSVVNGVNPFTNHGMSTFACAIAMKISANP